MINFEETILVKIQEECNDFLPKMKDLKNQKGSTNQEIADKTGIPISHIAKFFSGNLSNPHLFGAVAVCTFFNVSLDELFNLKAEKKTNDSINQLQAENEHLKKELELKDQLIHAHERSIRSARSAYEAQKVVMFFAVILITTLIIIVACYVAADSQKLDVGLIQNGMLKPIALVLFGIAIIATYVVFKIIMKLIIERKK